MLHIARARSSRRLRGFGFIDILVVLAAVCLLGLLARASLGTALARSFNTSADRIATLGTEQSDESGLFDDGHGNASMGEPTGAVAVRWGRDFGLGMASAVGDMALGAWHAVAHPIDTVSGLSHIGMTMLQAATGDHQADGRIVASGVALANTIKAAWAENPAKALGHGLVDVGTAALGGAKLLQPVGAGAEAATAARAVALTNAVDAVDAAKAGAAAERAVAPRAIDVADVQEGATGTESAKPPGAANVEQDAALRREARIAALLREMNAVAAREAALRAPGRFAQVMETLGRGVAADASEMQRAAAIVSTARAAGSHPSWPFPGKFPAGDAVLLPYGGSFDVVRIGDWAVKVAKRDVAGPSADAQETMAALTREAHNRVREVVPEVPETISGGAGINVQAFIEGTPLRNAEGYVMAAGTSAYGDALFAAVQQHTGGVVPIGNGYTSMVDLAPHNFLVDHQGRTTWIDPVVVMPPGIPHTPPHPLFIQQRTAIAMSIARLAGGRRTDALACRAA